MNNFAQNRTTIDFVAAFRSIALVATSFFTASAGSCQWRRLRIGNRDFIQELAEREYADLLIFPEIQHCPIASYYNVSVPRHSALENSVVRLVVENS